MPGIAIGSYDVVDEHTGASGPAERQGVTAHGIAIKFERREGGSAQVIAKDTGNTLADYVDGAGYRESGNWQA